MDILVVEDSSDVGLVTLEYLQELGHEGVLVEDAEKAIALLADRKFDAVLTDVRLPGMSGIGLAQELLKNYPELPVLICSGYGTLNPERLFGHRPSTVFMLPKPYDISELASTLDEAAAINPKN